MNQQLLQRVPRFRQLPDSVLLILIHSLMSRIYLPNEIVFLFGERGKHTPTLKKKTNIMFLFVVSSVSVRSNNQKKNAANTHTLSSFQIVF